MTGELNNPDDLLARFLFFQKHFKRTQNRATPDAFMPPPKDLQLSVSLITDLSANAVWDLGKGVLAQHLRPQLYGRADITVSAVHAQKLKAFRDDDPPRHVNVVGWPSYSEGKDAIKSIAQELARAAALTLLPTPLSK